MRTVIPQVGQAVPWDMFEGSRQESGKRMGSPGYISRSGSISHTNTSYW